MCSLHTNPWRRLLIATAFCLANQLQADEAASTNPASLFSRGETLYQAADWKGAADVYSAVLAQFPDNAVAEQALYSRGWARYQAGRFEEALADFRAFLEKYPKNALAAEGLIKAGDSLRQLRRFDEALQSYDQVRVLAGRVVPDALAGKAWVYAAQHDFAAAQGAFREAAQAYGTDEHAAALLYNAGTAAIEARQFSAAAELLGQVQQAWPTNQLVGAALYWQAVALFRQNKADEAAAKLEQLRQAGVPQALTVETTLLLAQVQDARHNYAEAAALYASITANSPAVALAETAAAGHVIALEKSGNLAAAEVATTAFLQKFPASEQYAGMQFRVGEYRYRQAKYAEAAPELEQFARTNPTHELAGAAWYKAAWCYWNLKQVAHARELFTTFRMVDAKSPMGPEAAFMIGRAAEASGDNAAAADGYNEAIRIGKDGDAAQRATVELIRLDQNGKRYEAALTRAEAFIASHAGSALLPHVRLYRAEALLELGRLPEALHAYQQVGEADPVTTAAVGYGTAWVLRRQGRYCESAGAFATLAKGASSYAVDARFWAARSYEDAGLFDAANTEYGACLQQVPPGPHTDEAAYRQAYCLWQTHKPDDAERLYSSLLHERAASPFAANALYDLAWVMMEQGKKSEARQRFDEFTRQFPKHLLAPDAHFRIGELACEKEEFAVAATHYEIAAAAQVAFRDKALYKLGWMREKLGQNGAAAQTFVQLARQFPASEFTPEAHYRAGVLLQAMGRFEEARVAFTAVTDSLFSEKAAYGVAECWRVAGHHTDAIDAYAQVLKKWPQGECRLQALLGRANELRAAGAFADAITDYATVSRNGETIEAAQAMLGQGHCWFALKNWEEAARCFLKVDVLYGFDALKPEALAMAARSWELAGNAEKAAMYRDELKKRFSKGKETQ